MKDNYSFSFGIFYGEIYLDLQYLPSKVSLFFDLLALLNGGVRDCNGYSFISEQGLLHFSFLTDNLGEYQAKWRVKHFKYQNIMEKARGDGIF
jgi:hypothetical protein